MVRTTLFRRRHTSTAIKNRTTVGTAAGPLSRLQCDLNSISLSSGGANDNNNADDNTNDDDNNKDDTAPFGLLT